MTDTDKSKKIEIIKILRKETGVSIGLCSEAVTEAENDLEKACLILRKKCIAVGEKFYNNPEKKIIFSAVDYRNIEQNHLHLVKIGCQSDFLIASSASKKITDYLIFKKNFGNFNDEDKREIEDELKYQSGLVKENIQLLVMKKIDKKINEHFYIFSNITTSNQELFNSVTIITYEGTLEPSDDAHHQLSINIHSSLKKKIVNIEEENKIPHYTVDLTGNDLDHFLDSYMVTDKNTTIRSYLKAISENVKVTHIFAI